MRKIFKIVINKDDMTGMDAISLVKNPAVERNFLTFNDEQGKIPFKFDTDKHIITGVVALADVPIYRFNYEIGEYWVVFDKDTIQTMVEKYAKSGLLNSVNLQHDDNQFVDGIYLIESYIISKERGICPREFSDCPDGSWIASFKVENEELWNDIKNGNDLNGFSLQGIFQLEESFSSVKPSKTDKEIRTELMKNFSRIALRNLILQFEDVNTDKGVITIDGEIKVGAKVYVGDELATDGEYLLDNGSKLVVTDGEIAAIVDAEQPEEKDEPQEPQEEPQVEETPSEEKPEEVEPTEETPAEEEKPAEEEPKEEVEEPAETPAETPAEETPSEDAEKDAKIAELEQRIAELTADNEALRAKLAEKDATIAEKDDQLKMSVEKYASQCHTTQKTKQTLKSYLK